MKAPIKNLFREVKKMSVLVEQPMHFKKYDMDESLYQICFTLNAYPELQTNEMNEIIVESQRELELILLTLGKNANVKFPELSDQIISDTYKHKLISAATWNYKNPQEAYDVIKKIPMPKCVPISLDNNNLIENRYVHKDKDNNIMLSQPVINNKLIYFRGKNDIDEFNLDHISDHVNGIQLFEAARQASIAALHVAGLPFGGAMALTSNLLEYSAYIEVDQPYYIQVLPVIRDDQKLMHCAFKIIQNNKTCTAGYFGIYHFKSKDDFISKRN